MLQSVPGLGSSVDADYFSGQTESRNASINPRDAAPRLIWAGNNHSAGAIKEIILENPETIIGSDAEQANIVLAFPSISPQHTLLLKSERGSVKIADLGSESGTWVNYAPVSSAGLLLHNGDLIKIGSLTFRYKIGKIF